MRPTDVFAVSRERAAEMVRDATRPTIVISISDPGDYELDFADKADLLGVLRVYFFDVEHSDVYGISREHAEAIVDFVEPYAERPVQVIVHCYQGKSRSAGVAAALQELLWGGRSEILDDWHYQPNKTCYKRVLDAARGQVRKGDKLDAHRKEFWRGVEEANAAV